ncbi:MAG: oligoendopeptidase F, partial [Ureaplasma sp.]|nr:oligoendopeptidase F [Ureaplasma sp.]
FNEAFNSIQDTLTKTLYYNYLMLNSNAKIRGFKDYVSATAFADEVDVDFIKFVYSNIKKFRSNNLEYAKTHSSILKSLFKLDKINPWDASLELTKQNISYTIPEAQQEVLEALQILGDEYTNKIKDAFKERWISWMPAPGKQTGAYSIGGTKGLSKYFISMNFDETIRSVYTLIHELGHSMNSFYTDKNQKIYDGTSIFYAEVASITNEMLLNYHLLNKHKNNKKIQLMIYDEMLSNFFATTTRQVIFSDFEYRANELINQSQPFTAKSLKKIYQECCNEYSSISIKNAKLLDIALITPLRIPHFYVGNFYVYKYAIGQIAAIIIAHEINQDNSAREKLFNFLSSGSSKTPIDTIKLLGIDLSTEQPWDKANSIIKSWLNEYKKLAKELKYIK